ncbi:MAG: hypothetical protein IME99_08200, partial [Proteobacteria bacterium]|nr:hypothetical protein [Pseudomonadota bacterium]
KRNRAGKRPAALKADGKKNKPGKPGKKNEKRDKSKKKRGDEAGKPDKKKSASGSKKTPFWVGAKKAAKKGKGSKKK